MCDLISILNSCVGIGRGVSNSPADFELYTLQFWMTKFDLDLFNLFSFLHLLYRSNGLEIELANRWMELFRVVIAK